MDAALNEFLECMDRSSDNIADDDNSIPDVAPTEGKENGRHRRNKSFSSSLLRMASPHRRQYSHPDQLHEEPCLLGPDLWETDNECHNATREGYTVTPDINGCGMHNVEEGLGPDFQAPPIPGRRGHHRAVSFDAALLSIPTTGAERDLETAIIRDRLHGYVRSHHQLAPLPET